jgi:hypothetical protein
MELLLTILSVLALWAFLLVLSVGLLLIIKSLESVRSTLTRIAMGVRAIEKQARPLGERGATVQNSLKSLVNVIGSLPAPMQRLQNTLDAAGTDFLRRL